MYNILNNTHGSYDTIYSNTNIIGDGCRGIIVGGNKNKKMSRTVEVKVSDLLEKIKENKIKHIGQYESAVKAFKSRALVEIEKLKVKAEDGETKLHLNLTQPIDNTEKYDELITQFEMEVNDTVSLDQNEFTKIVLDKTSWAILGGTSNTIYSGK